MRWSRTKRRKSWRSEAVTRATSIPHDLTLTPLFDALRAIAASRSGGRVLLEIVAPPHPSAGVGSLRVLRERAGEDVEVSATYEDFVRLEAPR